MQYVSSVIVAGSCVLMVILLGLILVKSYVIFREAVDCSEYLWKVMCTFHSARLLWSTTLIREFTTYLIRLREGLGLAPSQANRHGDSPENPQSCPNEGSGGLEARAQKKNTGE